MKQCDEKLLKKRRSTMIIENTETGRQVQRVAATMAIEDMYVSKEFIEKLLKVGNGEMTSEQLRNEVLKEYAK